jgi:hypothetical protein
VLRTRPGMTMDVIHRPCSCVGPGQALVANCNSRLPSRGAERRQALGLARPPVGGLRNTPGGTSSEASRSSVAKRRNAPSGAPRRRSAMRGPRFRERGPATPVSQLLAPGPSARERSPAIARGSRSALLQARGAASVDGGISPVIDPVGSGRISGLVPTAAPSSRRPMTTPLIRAGQGTICISTRTGQ